MMHSRFLFLPVVALLLVGGGCASSQPVATDTYKLKSVPEAPPLEAPAKPSMIEPAPSASKTWTNPGILPASEIKNKRIRITTEKGDIVYDLFADTAPRAVSNMVYLAKNGYYDGVIFHRIIPGFMAQGGDPLGKGYGGPGYKFEDELNDKRTYNRGTVAMANAGPDTNGSQFFIMFKDNYPLPHDYTIFGQVVSGMEVVDQLKIGDKMVKVTVEDVK